MEAQGNWADLTGSNVSELAFFDGFANRTKIDAIGLFTGQVGYSWNSLLLYLKGGAAVTRDRYEGFLTAPLGPLPAGLVADRGSETRWGVVIGIGGEYAFSQNWSFALEYDHLFMGTRDVGLSYDPTNFVAAQLNHAEHIRQDVDIITARINYRFSGPIVANIDLSPVPPSVGRQHRRHRVGVAMTTEASCSPVARITNPVRIAPVEG